MFGGPGLVGSIGPKRVFRISLRVVFYEFMALYIRMHDTNNMFYDFPMNTFSLAIDEFDFCDFFFGSNVIDLVQSLGVYLI